MEQILKEKKARLLTDRELVELSMKGKIPGYALEKNARDTTRAVQNPKSHYLSNSCNCRNDQFLGVLTTAI